MGAIVARGLLPAALPVEATAAHALDLTLEPGSICCIIGPPGAGKRAWLRTLAAIERPAAGDLQLAGHSVTEMSGEEWLELRRLIGYIPDHPALLSTLQANFNVTLAAHYHRIGDPESNRRKARQLLDRLGWRGPLDVLPAQLDPHQRLLIALARCLMLDPPIVFMHEPFRTIDASAWRTFAAVLAGLAHNYGLTLVVQTGHLPFVRRWADSILYTDWSGITEYAGWPALVAAPSEEVQDYLHASGMREREQA